MKLILIAGGIYHLCWALFDSLWPHFFAWKRTLGKLDDINRSLLYIVSRLLVLLYLYIATLAFFFQDELLNTTIGKTVLIFMTVYWGFRTIMQIQFFGFARAERMNIKFSDLNYPAPINRLSTRSASTIFFFIMLVGTALYLVPIVI
jgi:small-conductance mechanosensitive channel